MPVRLLLTLVAALALVAALPATSSAASKKRSCTAKGAKTVAGNRYARVFSAPARPGDYADERLFGCLYSKGRRVPLAEAYDDDYVSAEEFRKVRLRGRFVAWEQESYDISCKTGCPPGHQATTWRVHSVDLRSRRDRSYRGAVLGDSLVLGRLGTPAWLEPLGDSVRVRAGGAALDEGAVASLALRGSTLTWTNAGHQRGATLR